MVMSIRSESHLRRTWAVGQEGVVSSMQMARLHFRRNGGIAWLAVEHLAVIQYALPRPGARQPVA